MSIPNAEPIELFGGEIAVLMIHGFTGSPASIRPWAEGLHQKGFTVLAPRLPGHGTTWDEMNETRWQDWYNEVERALSLYRFHNISFRLFADAELMLPLLTLRDIVTAGLRLRRFTRYKLSGEKHSGIFHQ